MEKAIADLVSRLEKVTARLESVEKQLASGGPAPAPAGGNSGAAAAAAAGNSSPSVLDFDDLVAQHVEPYLQHSKKLGELVEEQSKLVEQAVKHERQILVIAASCKKPDQAAISKLIEPISKLITQITELREKNRAHKQFNNLSTISEGIGALGWIVVSPTPGPYVNESRAQSEFWSNRILKDFKGKDQLQVDWVSAFNGFLKELAVYIKKHHTTELTWNPRGEDASSFSASAAPSAGAPPPPPAGPPPPPPPSADTTSSKPAGPNVDALFSAINKGADITKGLKKVEKSQMTHKNPELRATSVVPAKESKSSAAPTAGAKSTAAKRPPKFALEGAKWVVEYQVGNKDIVISDTEAKQVVYIYRCENSVIQVKGKVNAITIDDCKKTGVVFENAISSCEIVNSSGIEVQCSGAVPSFAVDKTSGAQFYLSKEGLHTEFVTSKIDSVNILLPGESAGHDLIELAVPEQFKTVIKNNKLETVQVVHE